MSDVRISHLIDSFKVQVAAAADSNEIDRAFFRFVKEFAADRAAADYLALEEEARAALGTRPEDVDVSVLRDRFMQRVGAVRADFAKAIVETLDHKPPADREPYWYAAVHEHELAFDHLLRTVRGEGRC